MRQSVSLQYFLGLNSISGTYRSMIVMIGQIRAPAMAALVASAANRRPRLRVFHCLLDVVDGAVLLS